MRRSASLLGCLALLLCFGAVASAQEQSGSIQGIVKDASGAVLPGATVEARSANVVGVNTAIADASGAYRFQGLPPGRYELTVTLQGFTTVKVPDVQLQLGQVLKIDVPLAIATLAETVQVTSESPIIDVKQNSTGADHHQRRHRAHPEGPRLHERRLDRAGRERRIAGRRHPVQRRQRFRESLRHRRRRHDQPADRRVRQDRLHRVRRSGAGQDLRLLGRIRRLDRRHRSARSPNRAATTSAAASAPTIATSRCRARSAKGWRINPFTDCTANTCTGTPEFVGTPDTLFDNWNPIGDLGGPVLRDKVWFYFGSSYNRTDNERTTTFRNSPAPYETQDAHELQRPEVLQLQRHQPAEQQPAPARQRRADPHAGTADRSRAACSRTARSSPTARRPTASTPRRGTRIPRSSRIAGSAPATTAATICIPPTSTGVSRRSCSPTFRPATWRTTRPRCPSSPAGADPLVRRVQHLHRHARLDRVPVPADPGEPPAGERLHRQQVQLADGAEPLRSRLREREPLVVRRTSPASTSSSSARASSGSATRSTPAQRKPTITLTWNNARSALDGRTVRGTYGYYTVSKGVVTVGDVKSNNLSFWAQDSWTMKRNFTINAGVRVENETVPSYQAEYPGIEFSFADKIAPRLGFAYDIKGDSKWKAYGSYGKYFDITKLEMPRGSFGADHWIQYCWTLDTFDWPSINCQEGPTGCPGTFIEQNDRRHPSNQADPAPDRLLRA